MSRKSMLFVVDDDDGGRATGDMASLSDLDDILSSLSAPTTTTTATTAKKAATTTTTTSPSGGKQVKLKYHAEEPAWHNAKAETIQEEEVKGIVVRRIPLPAPSFESKRTIPGYEMEMNNTNGHDVKVVVDFHGANIRATPYPGFMLSMDMNTVEGVVPANTKKYVANVKPKRTDVEEFDGFDYNILVFPAQDLIREQTLEGVTLYTRVIYGKMLTYEFSAHNQKDHGVEVSVLVFANSQGDPLPGYTEPFKEKVGQGEKKIIGTVKAASDIASRWFYQRDSPAPASLPKARNIHKSEADGVIMYQSHISGPENALELKLENTRTVGVQVIIKLVGGTVKGDRLQKVEVEPTSSVALAPIPFGGSVSIEWAWDALNPSE